MPKNAPSSEEKSARIKDIIEAIGQHEPSDIEVFFWMKRIFQINPILAGVGIKREKESSPYGKVSLR